MCISDANPLGQEIRASAFVINFFPDKSDPSRNETTREADAQRRAERPRAYIATGCDHSD